MPSEIALTANFSQIRYAQCWEDADILLDALDLQPHHVCLSIASAGDNTLAMLSRNPKRVIAVDLNPAQIACLELRVAAYRELTHPELLLLIGARNSLDPSEGKAYYPVTNNTKIAKHRIDLYRRCRWQISPNTREFWDVRLNGISQGIGTLGKFERYLNIFRRYILPLIHNREDIISLLKEDSPKERDILYEKRWNNWRWQLLFRAFFSRFVMGIMGRDPSFFKYVEDNIAEHLLQRTRYALTTLNPAENPYLHWIVMGQYCNVLPYSLRAESFEAIRNNLDRLEWHCIAIEDFLDTLEQGSIDRYNLSDIFELMSWENYHQLLKKLVQVGRSKARLAYWNLLVSRSRPEAMADRLQPLTNLADYLHQQDKVFFYKKFILEEII